MFAALVLLLVVIAYRVIVAFTGTSDLGWIQNFSPMAALILCSAAFLPRRLALALPLGALFLSDLLLNSHYQVALLNLAMVPQYLAFGLIAALGWALRGRTGGGRIFGASLLGSALFYGVTNTGAWLVEPLYARSLAGWLQALTVGLPGYAPTWHFFRSTLLSDLAFTGLFVACLSYPFAAPQLGRAPVTA